MSNIWKQAEGDSGSRRKDYMRTSVAADKNMSAVFSTVIIGSFMIW